MSIGFYTEEELRELPFDLPSDLDIEREINRYVPPVCGGLGLFDIDLLDCTCDVEAETCYTFTYAVGDEACGPGQPADFDPQVCANPFPVGE